MSGKHMIIDGNAFYEIDEECVKRRNGRQEREKENTVRFQESDDHRHGQSQKKSAGR